MAVSSAAQPHMTGHVCVHVHHNLHTIQVLLLALPAFSSCTDMIFTVHRSIRRCCADTNALSDMRPFCFYA
jgi:hypothetical protein